MLSLFEVMFIAGTSAPVAFGTDQSCHQLSTEEESSHGTRGGTDGPASESSALWIPHTVRRSSSVRSSPEDSGAWRLLSSAFGNEADRSRSERGSKERWRRTRCLGASVLDPGVRTYRGEGPLGSNGRFIAHGERSLTHLVQGILPSHWMEKVGS